MKNMIRTNIRIYSDKKNDTNEYTNIFVSKKGYEYDTNEYSNIFEYPNIRHTMVGQQFWQECQNSSGSFWLIFSTTN